MEQETLLPDSAIRVMLVDDHKTMLWGLEKLLAGAQPAMRVVGCAGDIEAALAMAAALRPDVALLDIDLGGVSSVDFLLALLAGGLVPLALAWGRIARLSGMQALAQDAHARR